MTVRFRCHENILRCKLVISAMKKPIVVAIIPARGGSKGIPRKNARLLVGKPLIAYAIETCLAAQLVDEVYVSTEDAELSEIARRFGAHVLPRDPSLSADNVGLNAVVAAAVIQLEEIRRGRVDYVATVQATSPLLSPSSLDEGVRRCIEGGFDTVVSVVNDNHLSWGLDASGAAIPLYEKRLNRQLLPVRLRETGGFLVCRRDVIEGGSRFGEHVEIFKLDKEEGLDIDDRYDWWIAEKSLERRHLCFHVIGNKIDGLGHVYRALTLADRILDHDITFVAEETADLAIEKIRSRFYKLLVAPKDEALDTILKLRPDVCINDALDADSVFMSALKKENVVTINFEDMGSGSLVADYVINEMFNDHLFRKDAHVYSGVKYCCLRDEFLSITPKPMNHRVENVVIMFGGTDPFDMTYKVLNWLETIEGDWRVTVILGLGYAQREKIEKIAKAGRRPTKVVQDTPIVSRFMAKADIAITSAGRTVFELAHLGVPMITIAQGPRELTHQFANTSMGIISLGARNMVSETAFKKAFNQLLAGPLLRSKMRQALLEADVKNGIERVLGIINKAVAKAGQLRRSKGVWE